METTNHPTHKKTTYLIAAVLFIVALASAATGFYAQNVLSNPALSRNAMALFAVAIVGIIGWLNVRTLFCKCPRCGRRLFQGRKNALMTPGQFLCSSCHIVWITGFAMERE
jgi:hypothetical protein